MAGRVLAASLVLAVLGTGCGGDAAGGDAVQAGDVGVSSAWVRPSPGGDTTTAFYLTIDNTGVEADRLVAATSPVCAEAELHESAQQDGVMQMRPLTEGIAVPAGASIVLGPAGLHVMCLGVTETLESGQTAPLTLRFERAGTITVDADVRQEP